MPSPVQVQIGSSVDAEINCIVISVVEPNVTSLELVRLEHKKLLQREFYDQVFHEKAGIVTFYET